VLLTAQELRLLLECLRVEDSETSDESLVLDPREELGAFLEETVRQWLVEHRSGLAAFQRSSERSDQRRAVALATALDEFSRVLFG
jgi:hypothetical protein